MFSQNHNKFTQPNQNKLGFTDGFQSITNSDIPISMQAAMETAEPIWKVLNISEEEYYEQYHKPEKLKISDETISLEIIEEDEKND